MTLFFTEGYMNENKNPLTPALLRLMQACVILQTTDTKTIANHLNRSPATIRNEFQRILVVLNVHCRYAALKVAEENDWLISK